MHHQWNLWTGVLAVCRTIAVNLPGRTICVGLTLLFGTLATAPPARADEVRIGGTGAGLATMRLLAEGHAKSSPADKVTVLPSLGSSGGIKAVAAGAIQLAVIARPLSEAEQQQGLKADELGRTPFVFAVSAKNPVKGMTIPELVEIYSGATTQWPDGSKIRLVLRPPNDADSAYVRNLSPAMEKAKKLAEDRTGMVIATTDQDAQDNIEKIPGALGVTSLGQIVAEARSIKALSMGGVEANATNLANGSYPYVKTLLLVSGPKT